jgi:hypothetical protein
MTTENIDYDADLARRLDARLAGYAPLVRLTYAPRRTHRSRLAAGATLAAVTLTAAGVGFGANVYADEQGLSCADAKTKLQLFAATIADQVRGASIDEQRAAKQRVITYGMSLYTESCAGEFRRNADGTIDWRPKPTPTGAVPAQQPTFDPSRTPKPSNPLPGPTGR